MIDLKIGDVANMKSATVLFGGGDLKATFKAPRGRQMVFLFLGDESDTASMDTLERMKQLGWMPIADSKKK
jgi:hypothetical protein